MKNEAARVFLVMKIVTIVVYESSEKQRLQSVELVPLFIVGLHN